jgi:hypothetical protein
MGGRIGGVVALPKVTVGLAEVLVEAREPGSPLGSSLTWPAPYADERTFAASLGALPYPIWPCHLED